MAGRWMQRHAACKGGKSGMENRNGAANKTSIARRWITNSVGLLLLLVAILVAALSFSMQGYVYNGIQSALNGRSDELTNVFSSYGRKSASEFLTAARSYVEDFPNKENMELMVIGQTGKIVTTSIGFAPDQTQTIPDYQYALASSGDYGTWTGKLKSGERVMAVTRVIRNEVGSPVGAIRYVVSLAEADRQIFTIVAALILTGGIVILFASISSHYFIRSILTPIRQIGATAKLVAQGDFKARIVKTNNDEIGELCDTINDMADELGQNEKMKNDFISSVSHELRTPLTAIKGWAETIQSGETDSATFRRGMGIIVSETERLSGIVEELLDFSRMQSGRMTLTMDRIDLLAELGAAVYMFSERARNEHKFLVYDEPAMLPPVLGDINRLRQVFVNVLDNALKYTQEGGTINVTAEEEGGFIRVAIADDGCGIPAEHLPNVKKKFYKANQTVRGSGIGLALADEIMVLHSGSLDIDSHENVGTVVTIRIPTFRKLENNTREVGKEERNAP
jgi:signal transduction histidine kinase